MAAKKNPRSPWNKPVTIKQHGAEYAEFNDLATSRLKKQRARLLGIKHVSIETENVVTARQILAAAAARLKKMKKKA